MATKPLKPISRYMLPMLKRQIFTHHGQAVLKEVTESNGQMVMFIDEIHTVVGAGATSGSMDASNLLKPMLARGELRCIGATTLNEYKQVQYSTVQHSYCIQLMYKIDNNVR